MSSRQTLGKRKYIGAKDHNLIVRNVLRVYKKRKTNLATSWIYLKANDMFSDAWIMECMRVFSNASNTLRLLRKTMKNCRMELSAYGSSFGTVEIGKYILQGDCLSQPIIAACMVQLTPIMKKAVATYVYKIRQQNVSHFLFMNDLKLYGEYES